MQSIAQAPIKANDKVLARCDLDVPLENGQPKNTFRLDSNIPTLEYILEKGAHPIIVGKIGSPDGQVDGELSTSYLKPYFDEKLGEGKYTLLENSRFDPREKTNDPAFAKELADQAQYYVNECFATSHRYDATIIGVPPLLPSFAGFHLMDEVKNLTKITTNPDRPFIAVIGGAKVESKLPTVQRFLSLANQVLLGGLIGLKWTGERPQNLYIPEDYALGERDIGPMTIQRYTAMLASARTVLWVGPVGAYEYAQYSEGTRAIAQQIVQSRCFSIIGGGDTIQATQKFKLMSKFSFVSTGGSAMLEFLVRGNLVGLEALGYETVSVKTDPSSSNIAKVL